MRSALHRSHGSQLPIPTLILLFHSIHTLSLIWRELQEWYYTKMTVNQKLALMQFPLPALTNTVNNQQHLMHIFFKTLQSRVLAEKDFHWINYFSNDWSESRRIYLPCCFPWILALAFCCLPDIDAGSAALDCLTRSSYADSCVRAHVAYHGKLMSCLGGLGRGEKGSRVSIACSLF